MRNTSSLQYLCHDALSLYRISKLDSSYCQLIFIVIISAFCWTTLTLTDDWLICFQWARHYWGYTVCVSVGVAFIILMPIIGLILCLCRCAGYCGGKRRHDDVAKDNRCRRATCGLLLLILATLVTYVCYFCLLT